MKELEEKILKIIHKLGTDMDYDERGWRIRYTDRDAAKEIAALVEPLFQAYEDYIKFLLDKPASGTISHRIHREKIAELKNQLK